MDEVCDPQEAQRIVKSSGHGQGVGHERKCSISERFKGQLTAQDGEQLRSLAAVIGSHGFESCFENSHPVVVHVARFGRATSVVR